MTTEQSPVEFLLSIAGMFSSEEQAQPLWTDADIDAAIDRNANRDDGFAMGIAIVQRLLYKMRADYETRLATVTAENEFLRSWLRGNLTLADADIDAEMRRGGIEPCRRQPQEGAE